MKIRHSTTMSGPRHGFSLIEAIVVMWLVGALMLVGTATLLGALKVFEASNVVHQRMAQRQALADQFRADVAEAAAAPDRIDDLEASPTSLLLRTADGKSVVYRWHESQLERSVSSAGKTTRSRFPIGRDSTTAAFTREGADNRLITLRLTDPKSHDRGQRDITLVAALGGDLR